MTIRRDVCHLTTLALVAAALPAGASLAFAQASNGILTLTDEMVVSGGGPAAVAGVVRATIAIGEPIAGRATNGLVTVLAGSRLRHPPPPAGSRLIAVTGSVDADAASVSVNGVQAAVTGTTYRAEGVRLVEGPNPIAAVAVDPAGNSRTSRITVTLDTRPPARPTVAATPPVAGGSRQTLTGTKTAQTSLWVNGAQVMALGAEGTWSWTADLVEGDNRFAIEARDAAGNVSAANTVTIVRDDLPPVVTLTLPPTTNLTPYPVSGTVDDSLTTVTVNGQPASRLAKSFSIEVPLVLGANALTITARSPNGRVTTVTRAITLGTVPVIDTSQPADGELLAAGVSRVIQTTPIDREGDPVECQVLIDGAVWRSYGACAPAPWTPTASQRGLHTIEFRARDGFGGYGSKQVEVFVVRQPIPPP